MHTLFIIQWQLNVNKYIWNIQNVGFSIKTILTQSVSIYFITNEYIHTQTLKHRINWKNMKLLVDLLTRIIINTISKQKPRLKWKYFHFFQAKNQFQLLMREICRKLVVTKQIEIIPTKNRRKETLLMKSVLIAWFGGFIFMAT